MQYHDGAAVQVHLCYGVMTVHRSAYSIYSIYMHTVVQLNENCVLVLPLRGEGGGGLALKVMLVKTEIQSTCVHSTQVG